MTEKIVQVNGWTCSNCGRHTTQEVDMALWACSNCGVNFMSDDNRCEICHRFAAKAHTRGCDECLDGGLEPARLWQAPDGFVDSDLYVVRNHIANADRAKRAAERSQARSDANIDAFLARENATSLVHLKWARRVDVCAELEAATYDRPDHQAEFRFRLERLRHAFALLDHGDEYGAVREFRNLGQTITLDWDTFLAICERAQLADTAIPRI